MDNLKEYSIFINEAEEVKQKYYIYTLSDPTTGEVKYIGKSKDTKDRLARHLSPYNLKDSWTSKNKWLLWLKSQGLKPEIEILDEGDADNINFLEIYWIGQLKQWGYKLKNDTNGGVGCEYWKGKKLPDKMKLKTKMNNPLRREVCEYEIGTNKLLKTYDSIGDAKKETGYKRDTITKSCKGLSISIKHGVYWRFKDDYFPYIDRDLKHSNDDLLKMKMNNPNRKIICQYDVDTDKLIKEWDSSHDIERETGISRNHICKCCKGTPNFNTAGGYYWRFKDNYFPLKNKK